MSKLIIVIFPEISERFSDASNPPLAQIASLAGKNNVSIICVDSEEHLFDSEKKEALERRFGKDHVSTVEVEEQQLIDLDKKIPPKISEKILQHTLDVSTTIYFITYNTKVEFLFQGTPVKILYAEDRAQLTAALKEIASNLRTASLIKPSHPIAAAAVAQKSPITSGQQAAATIPVKPTLQPTTAIAAQKPIISEQQPAVAATAAAQQTATAAVELQQSSSVIATDSPLHPPKPVQKSQVVNVNENDPLISNKPRKKASCCTML